MTTILRSALLMFSIFLVAPAFAQSNLAVELAAFNKYVPLDYFDGIQGITYYADGNDIHRYRILGLKTMEDAKATMSMAKAKGFNARIVDVQAELALLEQCQRKLDHIFFDFDQSKLTYTSRSKLNDLASTLKANPDLQAILTGHTDAKGSNTYNDALSQARVREAMEYLLSQNVSANQISTAFLGEGAPIAKNSMDGKRDLPSGRKFNRRVEIEVINTASKKPLLDLVKKINVPSELKHQ